MSQPHRCLLSSLIVFLALVAPVAAELRDTEKVEVRKYHVAGSHIDTAIGSYLAAAIGETSETTKSPLAAAWRELVDAQLELRFAVAILVGVDEGVQSTLARPAKLEVAWRHTDRALAKLAAANSALTTAQTVPGQSSGYADAIRRAKDIWVRNGVTTLRGVNRALPYSNPRPVAYPQIVGPHGDYDAAQTAMLSAIRFLLEGADTSRLLGAYQAQTHPDHTPFRRHLVRMTDVHRKYRHFVMNVAIIPADDTECALNRFHLVARALGPVTSHTSASQGVQGAPYEFDNWQRETFDKLLRQPLTPVTRDAVLESLSRLTTAWRFADGAAWKVMEFPDASRLEELRRQAAPEQTALGPPLC